MWWKNKKDVKPTIPDNEVELVDMDDRDTGDAAVSAVGSTKRLYAKFVGITALLVATATAITYVVTKKLDERDGQPCDSSNGVLIISNGTSEFTNYSNYVDPILRNVTEFSCKQLLCTKDVVLNALSILVIPFLEKACQSDAANANTSNTASQCANTYAGEVVSLAQYRCQAGISGSFAGFSYQENNSNSMTENRLAFNTSVP